MRAYPRRWRQENGDEVVATLLDMADAAGRTRPSPGDIADLIAHGLAARLNVSLGLVPAQVRHRLAAMALASAAMLSLALFLVAEVLPEPYPALPAHPSVPNLAFGPFVTLGAVVYPFPVLAFVAAAAGYRRLTRTLLGLTGVALCVAVLAASRGVAERPQMYLLVVLGLLVVMAAGGLPTAVRRRDLFGAAAVFGLFLTVATAASIWLHRRTYWSDSPFATRWNRPLVAYRGSTGLLDTIEMATPAAVVLGILIAAVVSRRHPGWVIATFAVGGTWLLMPIA
ncbi:hypothetical protein, partial [Frankia sp. EI5c]|uniref:hypothetical protein n=1 Tax=Frankia sp. EI5c TaxID=683316 RepID=UPI001F5B05C3